MKSIYMRHFMATALMIVLSFLILGAAFIGVVSNYLERTKRESLIKNGESIARVSSMYPITTDRLMDWQYRAVITTVAEIADSHVVVCDITGTVIACSDSDFICKHIGMTVADTDLSAMRNGQTFSGSGTLNGIFEKASYIVGVPVISYTGTQINGFVYISSSSENITELRETFMSIFIIASLFVLLGALISANFVLLRTTRPLNEMAIAAKHFARGDFSVHVSDSGGRGDELGELICSFNAMADAMEKSEDLRRSFIANVSHELKTPMTTIAGYIDGILDGTIPREKQDKYLEVVSSEVRRMSRLVRRMLDIAHLQAGENEPNIVRIDINELIRRVLLGFEVKIENKALCVNAELDDKPLYVKADPDGITQVIYNLLDNAVKFSIQGSTLTIGASKSGGSVKVYVRNQGDPIPPEDLPYIFDRFHKTDRSRSMDKDGVGLGLYIVKSILSSHHQSIKATSENGESEFVFTLSLCEKEQEPGKKDFKPDE